MAITFVGFFRQVDPNEGAAYQREHGENPPEMAQKVREFPSVFSDTCRLIGSWAVAGGEAPGVTVVEAESFDDLAAINQHYQGWLRFDWHPTNTGGVPRD
jgi:hypothetical protein